jgi:hypothetical protein
MKITDPFIDDKFESVWFYYDSNADGVKLDYYTECGSKFASNDITYIKSMSGVSMSKLLIEKFDISDDLPQMNTETLSLDIVKQADADLNSRSI